MGYYFTLGGFNIWKEAVKLTALKQFFENCSSH